MDRVDAMKALQGWTDSSVLHFRNLAVFGEQILLSVRYGNWNSTNDADQARNWARFWRPEIQGYIHAYRVVTGVDLTAEVTDAQRASERYLQPSVHLRRQLEQQQRRGLPAAPPNGRTLPAAPPAPRTLPSARVAPRMSPALSPNAAMPSVPAPRTPPRLPGG